MKKRNHSEPPSTLCTARLPQQGSLLCLQGSFIFQKIINMKRRNYSLNKAASIPLAHLPRPLPLQEYFSFNLSPQCHKHVAAIYSFLTAIKIIPLISQNHGKLAPLAIFLLRPGLPLSWLQTHEQFMTVRGGFSFLHVDGTFPPVISILLCPYTYLTSVEISLK